jgi:hypothetical protein
MDPPNNNLLLLSGIPASGKSSLGRYLAREHTYAHYDLECYPHGWPHPELKLLWDSSHVDFVTQLRTRHRRIVLDWGFPPLLMQWVDELLTIGVRLVWFAADVHKARTLFIQRGGQPVTDFDAQVQAILEAGLPASLQCLKVQGLDFAGIPRDPSEIFLDVFGDRPIVPL